MLLKVSLTVYMAAMSLGFGPLPWVVNAELFPNEAKDKGTSINTLYVQMSFLKNGMKLTPHPHMKKN